MHTFTDLQLPAAVLFDLDGTLMDTEPVWEEAEKRIVANNGGQWNDFFRDQMVGIGVEEGASILCENTGIVGMSPSQIAAELIDKVSETVRAGKADWCLGALSLLEYIQQIEIPAYIVTSSYVPVAEAVIDIAPIGVFAGYIAGDEVENVKPHPEPYLRASKQLRVPIEQCLVFEDSPSGIASALSAGAVTVAVPNQIDIVHQPGLSRIKSLEEVDASLLNRLMRGEQIDRLV